MRETATNVLGSGSDIKGTYNKQNQANYYANKAQAYYNQGKNAQGNAAYNYASRVNGTYKPSGGGGNSGSTTTPVQSYDEYKSYIDNAYNSQKSAADAYMANVRKYANETYDENQRKSYSGLRAIERALSRRNTPFTGSQLWTVGQAYNNYNNALTGFGKTRQQAIDTGNVNYLSQLATAEGNKTDRYLKLLNA